MTVRLGSTGDDVRTLQAALRSRGFYTGAIDGEFGPGTEAAVRAAQAAHGLEVDGIAGPQTLTAILDPGNAVVAPSSPNIFPPLIEQWRVWFERAQAADTDPDDVKDPFPIQRSLKWAALESGGNACATGRIQGDHVMEAGLAQTYFDTPTTRVFGITSAELRALCPCEGVSQHGGTPSDHAKQIHTEIALKDMRSHRARARARLAKAGVTWDEGGLDFWCAVKLVHALPGLFSYLAHAKDAAGGTVTWALFKGYVQTRTQAELAAVDAGTARYSGAFSRVWANCESFARG